MDQTLAALLVCPTCAGDFLPGKLVCGRCGAAFAEVDEIASMISEGAHTALDDLDYDAVYRVDAKASLDFASSCLAILGDRLPARIDKFLEIGAGTGLFTLGFLKQVPTNTALITDISPAMLQTCRRRLLENGVGEEVALRFVTWDGARCLRPGVFDLIAGVSVLHHVLDFQAMLCTLHDALRPDGVALFLEPNYRFHVALVDMVCDIFVAVADDVLWTDEDRGALSDWLFENNTNLRFRGDDYMLAAREDKHVFDGTQIGVAARDAGFHHVEMLPFGERGECYVALKVYSGQIGLREEARQDLLMRFSRMLPGNFAHVADEDSTPSSLIVLRKGTPGRNGGACAVPGPLQLDFAPKFRFDLAITVAHEDDDWSVAVHGWVLGDADVMYVALVLADDRHKFPVRLMRTDINEAFNSHRTHPLRRTLFSGVDGARLQAIAPIRAPVAGTLVVQTADGREYILGEAMLTPDAGTFSVAQYAPSDCQELLGTTDGQDFSSGLPIPPAQPDR